jgi:phosphatidylinositol 4-kinase
MWLCLLAATTIIFEEYLKETLRRQSEGQTVEGPLEYHAEFLLVQFSHNLREIRRCADNCLTQLVDTFPALLWNGRVISTALLLIQTLTRNLDEDPDCRMTSLTVPGLGWSIQLQVVAHLSHLASQS